MPICLYNILKLIEFIRKVNTAGQCTMLDDDGMTTSAASASHQEAHRVFKRKTNSD